MGFIWMNILSGREPSLHGTHTSLSAVQTQPGRASGTECLTCGCPMLLALGLHGSSSRLPLKNAVLQREATVAQDRRNRVPAVAQEAALGAALPQAQELPSGKEVLGTFVLRVQIAWLLCAAALELQEQPPRSSNCLQAPKWRRLVLCDQCLQAPGHKPPALTAHGLVAAALHRQHHRSSLCAGLGDATAL